MTQEKPKPSEVQAASESRFVHQRDSNGDLIPEKSVIKADGEWLRVEHVPPTKGFLQRVDENMGDKDDVPMEQLDALMDDWYVDPTFEDWNDVDSRLYVPMMEHMVTTLGGDMGDGIVDEMREEIEQRQEEGN